MNQLKEFLEQLSPSKEKNTVEQFENIELTLEETEEALRKGREEKDRKLRLEEWGRKIKENPTWYSPSAKEVYSKLLETKSKSGKPFQVNSDNKETIEQLCLYFTNDARFKQDRDKGILLMGPPGVGKTHLMNFFAINARASYTLPTCVQIADQYRNGWTSNEMDALQHYSQNPAAHNGFAFGHKTLGICFGDLGKEIEQGLTSNFGNKKNVIEEIIFNRYERGLPFNTTHFTTNLNSDDIKSIYGERMSDRLKEMCNVISLECKSFR